MVFRVLFSFFFKLWAFWIHLEVWLKYAELKRGLLNVFYLLFILVLSCFCILRCFVHILKFECIGMQFTHVWARYANL